MKNIILVFCLLLLAACTDPGLSAGVIIGMEGVTVSPTLSGRVGDATVIAQP